MVVAGAAIHLTFLAANMTAVRLLGIGGGRSATASGGSAAKAAVGVQRAVILVTSQKTLPVTSILHVEPCRKASTCGGARKSLGAQAARSPSCARTPAM